MFRFVAVVLVFASSTALAQEAGAKVWVSEEVVSQRFFDEDVSGPEFKKDARVTLVMIDGDRARVFQGNRFGWIASANITTLNPNPPPVPPLGGGLTPPARFELPPGLDLGTP